MSSAISIPDALRSENRKSYRGRCWRVVEAQHIVSTAVLVAPDDQLRLEELIDDTKPRVPAACAHLHYLLQAPFRYPSSGSRWRQPGPGDGVFYTAEVPETAIAEMAFYRILFFAESPDTAFPEDPFKYSAFGVAIETNGLIDLVAHPIPETAHLTDYTASQDLARTARLLGATGVAQRSVRCPNRGICYSWLDCRVFAESEPSPFLSWDMLLSAEGIVAIQEFPRKRLFFGRDTFAADPRIAAFRWER
jgi:RES domain